MRSELARLHRGYQRPAEDRVDIGLGYATRTSRLPPGAMGRATFIGVGGTLDNPRRGGLGAIEGGRCILTLGGILGDYPPIDPAGFDAFAASLPFPDIAQAIGGAEPLEDPVGFRFPASVRHRYERLREFPHGLLVLGDAISSFNPLYGQGMTVAANQALALRRLLTHNTAPSPRQHFRLIAKTVDPPWDIAVSADLAFPDVPGTRTLKIRLVNTYIPRLHAAAVHDAALSAAFIRPHPRSLLHQTRK